MSVTRTTCPYCGVGCGVTIDPSGQVTGDRDHPANFGRLCSKGSALGETLALPNRLLSPRLHGKAIGWDAALDEVAARFADAIAQHGPDSVAIYGSGQLLTEDYYVANKLMKGCIGTGNMDTNSRLCMASTVAGQKRAFGGDIVPGQYEDLEQADLVVLVGSNTAWCHPVLYQRLIAAKQKRGTRIVVIDPRRTATTEDATLHLAVKPGGDVALFNGLLIYLIDHLQTNHLFNSSVTGLAAAEEMARAHLRTLERDTGLSQAELYLFYDWFARTEKVVTVFSQGVNQSSAGTDKVNAIINVHLATGRIGRPGMGPLSATGQPNAMGGREVGGLANQLAAHLDIDGTADRDLLARFWKLPRVADKPGLKAVDLFTAAADGKIQALWIMATNPMVSLPDADVVRRALERCPFVIVSDIVADSDTARRAHLLLPAAGWGEKDGTVTNSERRISRQRAFRSLPDGVKPDWWAICEVGKRLGFSEQFAFQGPADIFREHAALSGFENDGRRVFDISALDGITAADYEGLKPFCWPWRKGEQPTARLFADGRFPTPDGKARIVPVAPRPPVHTPRKKRPLILNTARLRDQWHTMTRTGIVERLGQHRPVPQLHIHPDDAGDIQSGQLVEVTSDWGRALLIADITADGRAGEVAAMMHWTAATGSGAEIGPVVNPAVDPVSGQPELKHTPVSIKPLATRWQGLLILRDPPVTPPKAAETLIVRQPMEGAWVYRLTASQYAADPSTIPAPSGAEFVSAVDRTRGKIRWAAIRNGQVEALFFAAPADQKLPDAEALIALLALNPSDPDMQASLLAGRLTQTAPRSPQICICFGITQEQIETAIAGGCQTTEALGAKLRCGTNCGSCLPELKEMIRHAAIVHA
ncbi:molybdopterin-dependent oxidoreductase [Lacibacterium aquatile]|uniref:Molybdopterin-dependent oxidoreductase n=1 Tax=Lacibacterium aquatile TaxID=1168082 RepID=A0ABW5DRX5_9PROT